MKQIRYYASVGFLTVLLVWVPRDVATADSDPCQTDAYFAEAFMEARQSPTGWSLTEMMSRLGLTDDLRALIIEAYDYPRMLTPETRAMAVDEFRDKAALRCYRDGPMDVPKDD